ncbi:MAG: trypsin-like peptidase domain-containing protein, partial [Bacteroidetes bacterium]|nr:trypsin-like peptidase domain-containing protein [Bacteroidota bacterium]
MDVQAIIEKFRPAIIQIAAPESNGTGFYLTEYNLIITNFHVTEGVSELIIKGKSFDKTFTKVWYTDKKHDLSFLKPPDNVEFGNVSLGNYETLKDGDDVIAIGHPFGLSYSATLGVIS